MFEVLSLPFESKSPVGRAAAQEGCKPPGLNLNNGSDLVLLSKVPFLRNQPFEHSRADQFARLTIQEAVFHPDIHAQIDRAQDRAIHDRLPELFHQIKNQRRLTRPVHVKETREGFQTGIQHRAPNVAVQDSIAVIQHRVHGVRRAA